MGYTRMASPILLLALVVAAVAYGNDASRPLGEDLALAPPSFYSDSKLVVPVDFQFERLSLKINIPQKTASATAEIEFYSEESGYPMFDMVPNPIDVTLNGIPLGPNGLVAVTPPCKSTEFRILKMPVAAGSYNTLLITYRFPAESISFSPTGVKVGLFMSDVSRDRSFLERYAPANFEFDRFRLSIQLELSGTTTHHQLFTNGDQTAVSTNKWNVYYPYYYTSSSPYLHLTDSVLYVKEGVYSGEEREVKTMVYSQNESLVPSAEKVIQKVMAENERTFGPYAHDKFLAYLTDTGGGMEYAGATVTSLSALGHELTHSWFARGVMPPNGNSGWIDEAIASWRDAGYPSQNNAPSGPVNLAAFSPYRRTTPIDAYTAGSSLLGFLNRQFADQQISLVTTLSKLFIRKRKGFVTSSIFERELESALGVDLTETFNTHVYGKGHAQPGTPGKRTHPRPFTPTELVALR